MNKSEWIETFEEIHGRKPSVEEILAAEESGEIVPDISANQNKCADSIDEEPKVEIEGESKYRFSGNGSNYSQYQRESTANSQSSILDALLKIKLFAYLKHCFDNKYWGFLIYFVLLTLPLSLIPVPLAMFMLSETGQNLVCMLIGAKRIQRQDHIEVINRPIANIIAKARTTGLNLPDNIELRVIQSELPTAYAIGMNRIVVSENLLEDSELLETKLMFELHRIHNMAPNLLLTVVGVNVLLVIFALIVMLYGRFQSRYGSRAKSFWTGSSDAADGAIIYYLSFGALMAFLGLTFLFVKSVVKRDVIASDKFISNQGLGQLHCLYLDKISKFDQSQTKKIFEIAFPDVDERIAIMQGYGVSYNAN